MIPKIIHQIWIGPKKCPDRLIQTWRDKHPESEGWKHILWTNNDIDEFEMLNRRQFDSIEEWAGKADIWRYEILYRYGGIFCDADSICINQLDDHFLTHDSFAGFENEECRGQLVANGYIGATKGNRLMRILIDEIKKKPSVTQRETGKMAWQTVGPLFFTEQIIQKQYPISIYPSFVFIPEHYSGIVYKGTGKSYSRQLWGSTQELRDQEFYNKL